MAAALLHIVYLFFIFISRFDCVSEIRFFSFPFRKLLLIVGSFSPPAMEDGVCRGGSRAATKPRPYETKPKLDFKTAVEINSNCFQFNFYFSHSKVRRRSRELEFSNWPGASSQWVCVCVCAGTA